MTAANRSLLRLVCVYAVAYLAVSLAHDLPYAASLTLAILAALWVNLCWPKRPSLIRSD